MQRRILCLSLFWLASLSILFTLEYYDSQQDREELLLTIARTFVQRTMQIRKWNALHGGVYIPFSKDMPKESCFDNGKSHIIKAGGLQLVRLNPGRMTMQLEKVSDGDAIRVHLISVKPVCPEERATPREQKALELFKRGAKETGEVIANGADGTDAVTGSRFFYMSPIVIEKPCLKCHPESRVGDIMGGISLLMRIPDDDREPALIFGNAVIGLIGLIGIFVFGTKLNESYQMIQEKAVMDGLTGIHNRRALMEQLPRELRRCARQNKPLSVLMADIDHFKAYNDAHGHAAGDKCLQAVAQAIKESIRRPGDFCARYGGEEFVVLLPETGLEAAVSIAETIRAHVEMMGMPHQDPPRFVTVSLGVALSDGKQTDSQETALQEADKALYKAKTGGRNRVEVFTENLYGEDGAA